MFYTILYAGGQAHPFPGLQPDPGRKTHGPKPAGMPEPPPPPPPPLAQAAVSRFPAGKTKFWKDRGPKPPGLAISAGPTNNIWFRFEGAAC